MHIKVYYAPPSVYGRKVLCVLDEKGLDYEIERMSFQAKDHQKGEYLRVNPNGEIPALDDNGFIVYESTAIIEYLEDEYPEPRLMPEDSEGRARIRMIEDFCDLHMYPAVITALYAKHANEDASTETLDTLKAGMQRLEHYLGAGHFIAGDFSLADCAVMALIATFDGLGLTEEVVSSPKLKNYFSRLKTRPGYKGANLLSFETSTAS